ncbi:hypothetical protein WME90_40835 [Sorangium sp. So ce375]|uniref:hypothetical protein n=1 Tax=Sorangium sp. So ce375 TaxID=3133306 RepID=UPI003F5AEAD8
MSNGTRGGQGRGRSVAQPRAPHPATVAQPRAPHPATAAQPRALTPTTVAQPRAPHPATVAQPRAPHPATVAQPRAPHPATVAQPKAAVGLTAPGTVAQRASWVPSYFRAGFWQRMRDGRHVWRAGEPGGRYRPTGEQHSRWHDVFSNPVYETLSDMLYRIFSKASAEREAVRYAEIYQLIVAASPQEITEAARDEEMLEAGARVLAPPDNWIPYPEPVPNDFPDLVKALKVRLVGAVRPHDPGPVDDAVRKVLGDYVRRRVDAGVNIAEHYVVLSANLFKAAQRKYAASLPGGGQVNAFTEEGTIYLSTSRGEPSTIIHEGIHLYASGNFRRLFGDSLDEGVTEYFARRVAITLNYQRDRYRDEHAAALRLVQIFGELAVGSAYFRDDHSLISAQYLKKLKAMGVSKLAQREASWLPFLQRLKEKKWDEAFRPLE